ncbi:CinA family protein [Chitinibacteraceae bacterium HSL-7]
MTQLAARLGSLLRARGATVATAESCTGGLIAAAITDVAGSSAWFERGWITYANSAKVELLGVPLAFIQDFGAVSEPVVAAMVQGACAASGAAFGIAVSGVAGPDGGSADKPVGTVWFAFATPEGIVTDRQRFGGDRAAVRAAAVEYALEQLVSLMEGGA